MGLDNSWGGYEVDGSGEEKRGPKRFTLALFGRGSQGQSRVAREVLRIIASSMTAHFSSNDWRFIKVQISGKENSGKE